MISSMIRTWMEKGKSEDSFQQCSLTLHNSNLTSNGKAILLNLRKDSALLMINTKIN